MFTLNPITGKLDFYKSGSGLDHGLLAGLGDDDHTQYHNDTRGDVRYAPIAKGVTNGDTHDHVGGDGAQISHTSLSNIGSNTHAALDAHLASTANPHAVTLEQAGGNGVNIGDIFEWNGSIWVKAAPSGSSWPGVVYVGKRFYRTDRDIEYIRSASGAWIPIRCGAVTMYVDTVNGTDDVDHGFGSGTGAFKTITYALNQIPGDYSGNVLIYIGVGNYAENVSITGKKPTGTQTITLQGTLTTLLSATADTITAGGTNALHGLIYDAGAFTTDYSNKLIKLNGNGDYRTIDRRARQFSFTSGGTTAIVPGNILKGQTSGAYGIVGVVNLTSGSWAGGDAAGTLIIREGKTTFQNGELVNKVNNDQTVAITDVLTASTASSDNNDYLFTVSPFSSSPADKSYVIYDWGTNINPASGYPVSISGGQQKVNLNFLKLTSTGSVMALDVKGFSEVTANYSYLDGGIYGGPGTVVASCSLVRGGNYYSRIIYGVDSQGLSFQRTKFILNTASSSGVQCDFMSAFIPRYGCIFDGRDVSSPQNGILMQANSGGNMSASASSGLHLVIDWGTGMKAETGSQLALTGTSYAAFMGCITTKNTDAYGSYIT